MRDMRVDALRGLMLVGMMIAHSYNKISVFTARSIGFADVAAGFVLMAGIAAGLAYARIPARFHLEVDRAMRRRAFQLWLAHLGLVALLLTARLLDLDAIRTSPTWSTMLGDPLWLALIKYASLLYQTPFLDILPMYCLFVLAAPLVVRQLRHGRGAWVVGISATLWLGVQFGFGFEWLGTTLSGGLITPRNGTFDPLAWQALFVGGLLLAARPGPLLAQRPRLRTVLLVAAIVVAVVLFLLNRVWVWWPLPSLRALLPPLLLDFARPVLRWEHFAMLVNKEALAPVCMLNFAVIAYLVWRLAEHRPAWFRWRWFALLGRNSLPVFVWHIPAVFLAHMFVRELAVSGFDFHLAYGVLSVASLAIPALIAERLKRRSAVGAQRAAVARPA